MTSEHWNIKPHWEQSVCFPVTAVWEFDGQKNIHCDYLKLAHVETRRKTNVEVLMKTPNPVFKERM